MAGGGKTSKVLPRIAWTMGHEMGIMWGFIGLFIISTGAFAVFWVGKNKRQAQKERERQEVLRQAGWGLDGWKDEKGDRKFGYNGTEEERVERVERANDINGQPAHDGVLGKNETGVKNETDGVVGTRNERGGDANGFVDLAR